ncbi:MAG: restriction endonuclease subunit S [Bacteroides fragilis]
MRFPEFTGEWKKSTIGSLSTKVGSGVTPRGGETVYKSEGHSFVRSQNVGWGHLQLDDIAFIDKETHLRQKNTELQLDDVLLNITGASIGRSALVNKQIAGGNVNQHVCIIRTKDNLVPAFLCNFLLSNHGQKQIDSFQAGGNRQGLNFEQIRSIKITIPSTKEQTKIATLLHLIDERIATQNKIIERYESLIRGINQYAFTNTGINYKLGEICEIRSGYSGNQLTLKNGLKVSRIETISGHKVNMERVGYVAPFESSENYRLQIGDILFSNINSVEYIGNTAFIDKDYNLYHGMNLLRLIPKKELVMPFYLYLVLNTNRLLNHFKTVCNKAVSQASINQTELGKTIVRIPNLMNQNRICELFQTLYTKLEAERYFISLLQDQKQHLLRQMFI